MKAAMVGAFGRASRALAWYYAIAVAVPVLNGATLDSLFLEHVAFVLAVPIMIVTAAACALRLAYHRSARGSRNATISSPFRTSRTSPTSTGWFQVLPRIAVNRASSVNWPGVAWTRASSPSSDSTSSRSWSGSRTSWPLP